MRKKMINKNDNLIAYFKGSILFLNTFKWIYDFQTTDLFPILFYSNLTN